jgi:CRP/FNR family transcriptional regulator, cyclic AMP receptor protein
MNVSSPILDALSEADRGNLLARAVPRVLNRSDMLFLAGERSTRAHLLLDGIVKLGARTAEGRETILGLAVPGEFVGEVSSIDGLAQPVDATAATRCRLLGIDSKLFMEALARNGGAALALARTLARRNRWLSHTALERTSAEVPARLAGRLLDLGDLLGEASEGAIEMVLPVGQRDLGRLAGVCRESACKTLRRFQRAGLVDYRGRRLRITRPDALERIRCAGRDELSASGAGPQGAPRDLARQSMR